MNPSGPEFLLLLAYILLALGFSFLCSIAEAVLLSLTPSWIESQKEHRPKRAALLKRLKQDNIDRSLAAILTLNTIAHTVGAIGAGAQAMVVFGSAWFGLFSAVMTLLILFLSEIVPKTIGAVYWARLAGPTAHFVNLLVIVLYPVVWLSERVTRLLSRGKASHVFSREELVAMASAGLQSGTVDLREYRIVHNLFRFGSLRVTDIMTPRTVMTALPEDESVDDALPTVTQTPFSRLPIYRENVDQITGVVLKHEVLAQSAGGDGARPLSALRREILVVPQSLSLMALLERFLEERQHLALVVSEHGGTDGLVTLEDIIETLMGLEIVDETDNVQDMRALARRKWRKRAKGMRIAEPSRTSGTPEDPANVPPRP